MSNTEPRPLEFNVRSKREESDVRGEVIELSEQTKQQNQAAINKLRKVLTTAPDQYIESIGRADEASLANALKPDDSSNTALRLVLGATSLMPFRALSYADAALRVARIIPTTQIQIVHANQLGHKINGMDIDTSVKQSSIFAEILRRHIGERFPELEGRVLHGNDTPFDTDVYADVSQEALDNDPELAQTLAAKGEKNGGNAIRYGAAHYAFQDTDKLDLDPFSLQSPSQIYADRIISIGGLQEKNFYRLRMGMQTLLPADILTAQIFTRHLSPPYYMARDGEPTLTEDVQTTDLQAIADRAARRDIEHFFKVNQTETQQ